MLIYDLRLRPLWVRSTKLGRNAISRIWISLCWSVYFRLKMICLKNFLRFSADKRKSSEFLISFVFSWTSWDELFRTLRTDRSTGKSSVLIYAPSDLKSMIDDSCRVVLEVDQSSGSIHLLEADWAIWSTDHEAFISYVQCTSICLSALYCHPKTSKLLGNYTSPSLYLPDISKTPGP